MSVSGISSSGFSNYSTQSVQDKMKQMQQEFQQLGNDLQSGNLSAARADYATLQQLGPQSTSTSSAQSNNPIAQAFNQLSKDLKSGNLPAAQQDYAQIQQDLQSQASQMHGHHHHHHGGSGGASTMSQLFDQLGQALQSGDLSSAQQSYNALQQDFQQLGQSSSSSSPTAGVSVTA